MKKLFLTLSLVFVGALSSYANQPTTLESQLAIENPVQRLNYSVGYLDGWSKHAECRRYQGDCAVAIEKEKGMFPIQFKKGIDKDQLVMSFTEKNTGMDDRSSITFNTRVVVSAVMAKELGFSTVIVHAGEYKVNYENNPFGDVVLDVIME